MAENWVGVWGASPAFPNGPSVANTTIRQYMRTSLAADRVRFRLTNELGESPLVIGAANIALPNGQPGGILPDTVRALTFAGLRTVVLQPGVAILSDPVDIELAAFQTLALDLFIARATGVSATHPLGQATAWLAKAGDVTKREFLPAPEQSTARFFISRIEADIAGASSLVTLGDSITDGYGTTQDADRRWPDVLAERLVGAGRKIGVVNAGISGNRVLHGLPEGEYGPAALARFDRDVLSVPNVRAMVFLESINDIGHSGGSGLSEQEVSARQIIAGITQIIIRAKEHGIRVFGGTLTPYRDTMLPGYYNPEGEKKREEVNRWIREGSAFDAVIDFDAAVRDATDPQRLKPEYDHGDHLHLSDAGYRRMGEMVDLGLFE
ncbi:SGNH/GDSL hydrolase family protein [Kozakia baliensis]|uniref:Lysophospholipase n=1 Tax=Kozakia baliensis TaxID=153496 RepID=A0A1D8UW18_9PROT|nr:SGNH/GDSL hydrolase family protein [Kozakia baliensis]AOX17848.1 lysophospholipase [Kozakia baliensis]GBR26743.1 lysophospholipase L1 [Kozakia baliensis NRIC 0488]GEL64277.1 SGNH hydrolase [Kozakia baliensis]